MHALYLQCHPLVSASMICTYACYSPAASDETAKVKVLAAVNMYIILYTRLAI